MRWNVLAEGLQTPACRTKPRKPYTCRSLRARLSASTNDLMYFHKSTHTASAFAFSAANRRFSIFAV